eukprot:353908-Chlamydomonas_euryale.AAC.2
MSEIKPPSVSMQRRVCCALPLQRSYAVCLCPRVTSPTGYWAWTCACCARERVPFLEMCGCRWYGQKLDP